LLDKINNRKNLFLFYDNLLNLNLLNNFDFSNNEISLKGKVNTKYKNFSNYSGVPFKLSL
jgi:hypothetical protein